MSIQTYGAHQTAAAAASPARPWPRWLTIVIGVVSALFVGLGALAFWGPPYVTSVQSRVLIKGVDLDKSLLIAEQEMPKEGIGSVLAIWGIRDQVYTEAQAQKVSELYFRHVDAMSDYFRLWHLTWAISNVYRNGDALVRARLESAYEDATKRARAAGGLADAHVNGSILMGDIHFPARLFVQAHVVAPGTPGYLQSLEDYKH